MANKKIFTGYTFEGGGQSKNLRLEAATSDPTNVGKGHAYYNTTAGTIKVSNADSDATASWKTLLTTDSSVPFSSLTGTVDADTLDGSSKSNAVGNNTIPVRDSSNLFHVGSATANPTENTHVANKRYVDSVAQGLTIIDPCYLATTAALPNHSYNNGTSGVGATMTASANGALSIDGNAVSNGKRILVKDQANNAHNGIYTVTNAGSGSAAFVLTRATDYDEQGELLDGDFVFVQEGTVNANRGFVQTSNYWTATTGTVGTHSITWTQFSGAGQISVTSNGSAAAPLTKSGDTINFAYNTDRFALNSNALDVADGGIQTDQLGADSVTPLKLDDSASFTMGGLTVNGTAQVFSTNSPATLEIKGGTAWESSGSSMGTNGNEHARLDFKTSDSSVNNPAVAGRISSVIENPNSAYNGLAFSTFDQTSTDRLNKQMQLTYQGKLALGKDAVDALIETPSGAGTLHVSTARYSTTNEITDGNAISTSNWSTSNSTGMTIGTPSNKATYNDGVSASLYQTGIFTQSADAGKRYKLTFTIEAKSEVTFTSALLWIGRQDGGQEYVPDTDSNGNGAYNDYALGTHEVFFDLPDHTTATGLAFYAHSAGSAFVISNISLYEDLLSTSGSATVANLSVNSAADDLVIANNDHAGISILSPKPKKGNIYFGDRDGNTRGVISFDHSTDYLTFGLGGDGGGNYSLQIDNSRNAKFAGGVGIGAVAGAGGQGLMVDKSADDDWVAKIKNSSNTTPYGLQVDCQGSNTVTAFAVYAGESPNNTTFAVKKTHSYFSSNLVVGGTTAYSGTNVTSLTVDATSYPALALKIGGTTTALINGNSTTLNIDSLGDRNLILRTNDVDRLSFDGSGIQNHHSNPIVNSATVAGLQDGGACYDFDGANTNHIALPTAAYDAVVGDRITVAAWIKRTSDSGVYDGIVAVDGLVNQAEGFALLIDGTDDKLFWQYDSPSGAAQIDSNNSGGQVLALNKWYHVVGIWDGSNLKTYVNGVLDRTQSGAGKALSGTNKTIVIGNQGTNSSAYFRGQIRDVKIFPSALEAADVRKLYSGENPKKNLNVELVEGGQFNSASDITDNNPDNWRGETDGGSNTVTMSVVSGEMEVTSAASASTVAYATVTTVVGKAYLFSVNARTGTSAAALIRIGTGVGSSTLLNTTATTQETINATFVATSTTTYISLGANQAGSKTAYFDNVSVTEVGTLVDFTPQSASSTKWRNEAIPSLYHGTVNNATLSQGNTYWNNIKQDGAATTVNGLLETTGNTTIKGSGGDVKLTLDRTDKRTYSIYTESNNEFRIRDEDGSADRFSIASDGDTKVHGKLGVGTSADASIQMTVGGAGSQIMQVKSTDSHASVQIDRKNASSDANLMLLTNGVSKWRLATGLGGNDEKLTVYDDIADVNMMVFKTGVGVGVGPAFGTAEPANLLHLSGADESMLMLQANTGSTGDKCHIGFGCSTVMLSGTNIGARLTFERRGASTGGDLAFHTRPVGGTLTERFVLRDNGTQDHKANRIVNSQTVNDSWRTSEPSLRFDGDNDYVQVADTTLNNPSSGTISAWIKYEGFNQSTNHYNNGAILAKGNVYFSLTNDENKKIVAYTFFGSNGGGQGDRSLTGTTVLETGKWYHVLYSYASNKETIYINGVQEATRSGAYGLGNIHSGHVGEDCRIGAAGENTTFLAYFNGEIKDVRIHNRALDADEIKGLYNGESTPYVYADSAGDVTPSTANGDASVWSKNSDATLTYDTDHMELANNTAAHGAYLTPANMGITATVGKRYRISAKFKNGTASGVSVRLQAYPLTGDGLVDHTTTSSFVEVSTEFTATQAFTQVGVWPLSDLNNSNIEFKDFKFEEVGEVAAYTPKTIDAQHSQSAKHKWLDATSNNNHGSITGCTPVGDNDHRGILRVHSNSDAGSAYAHQHLNGTINIGSHNNYQGRIDYNATGGTEFLIDNSYNSNSAKTQFGMKTAGTRLPVLELVGDGSVKATSAASDNLKQVARVHSQNITFNSTTSAIAFRVLHNLGTKYVTVSVCENATSSGQNAAHVETEVRLGDYVGADIGAVSSQQSNTDENYVTIIFAAHQGNNTAFKVTVIG